MNLILNPLDNPILLPVILRLISLLVLGFLLVFAMNKFNLKKMLQSEAGKRYIGWLYVIPLFILAVLFGGVVAEVILFVILFIALKEIYNITKIPIPYFFALMGLSVLSVFIVSYYPNYFYTLPVTYFMILTLIGINENSPTKSFEHVSIALFVSIWLIFSMCHFILLNDFNIKIDNTKSLLFLVVFAVALSDIFAYFVGKFFTTQKYLPSKKIASKLSKNKTYIGALGNILGAMIGILIMYFILQDYLSFQHWVAVAIIIGIMGVTGDVTESMFKRYYKAKDSGTILPGHGGVLDRLDSTLRVIVVIYYYFLFIF